MLWSRGFGNWKSVSPDLTGGLDEVIHGTTLVINAIIERKGANTGLITTKGFRDVLELGREIRYAPYDIFAEFPEPLIPRRFRLEVDERVRSDGTVLKPLDPDEARAVGAAAPGHGRGVHRGLPPQLLREPGPRDDAHGDHRGGGAGDLRLRILQGPPADSRV